MPDIKKLSPETITAVEIFENISPGYRNQALDMLRSFVEELNNEQKWEKLYSGHSGPMLRMAREALEEYHAGKNDL